MYYSIELILNIYFILLKILCHNSCAAGAVVGLSALAVCAPSEKLLKMGGPLAIGFGILFTASLASK